MICDYCEREHDENGLWVYQREDLNNITLCDDCWGHTLTIRWNQRRQNKKGIASHGEGR